MTTHTLKLRRRSYWQRLAAVTAAWLKAPAQVASVAPSSMQLTHAIANRDCVRTATKIVDLGPGTGGTTEALLEVAGPHCRVLAIEKTAAFIESLRQIEDDRLIVQQEDAVGLERILLTHRMSYPDVIISGIPFSTLPESTAATLIRAIHRTLADGGTFIAYQLRRDVFDYAVPLFGQPDDIRMVWFNLPPLRIYTWRKAPAVSLPPAEPAETIAASA